MTAGCTIARGEHCREVVGAPLAFADMNERTDHRTHLVLQKRTRRGADADLVAIARHVEKARLLVS